MTNLQNNTCKYFTQKLVEKQFPYLLPNNFTQLINIIKQDLIISHGFTLFIQNNSDQIIYKTNGKKICEQINENIKKFKKNYTLK